MKTIFTLLVLISFLSAASQQRTENIIIITTDGFRWQEVFGGMDSAIANNSKFNQGDSEYIFNKYWSADASARRKKLMPFLWSSVVQQGQVYGNRLKGNKVDNANRYWFSYPGYSEIFTGYADTAINSNSFPPNPHTTVLEFLNNQPRFKNKVAAFGAWEAFGRILNEERSKVPVFSAFDSFGGKNPNDHERLINAMLHDSRTTWGEDECPDVFTHYGAMEYMKSKKPRVFYIGYGETDEWAHDGKYRSYLDAGHQVDAWISEIWNYVQSDPQYRNKTSLFITVDHGRGDINKKEWTSHNNKIADSHEIWFAVIGPDTPVRGEISVPMQLYQQQFAQTFATLLGYRYKADHPVAPAINEVFKKK